MFTAIDHFVIVVPELDAAIRDYADAGFTVVRGGRHNIGTHNALIAFADDSYIELIAFLNPVTGHPWYTALEKSGGIVDFCMQTDDLTADARSDAPRGRANGRCHASPLHARFLRLSPENASNLRLCGGADEFELPVPICEQFRRQHHVKLRDIEMNCKPHDGQRMTLDDRRSPRILRSRPRNGRLLFAAFARRKLTRTSPLRERASELMQVRSLHGRHCPEGSASSAVSTLERHA
jgi:hypothetical protein